MKIRTALLLPLFALACLPTDPESPEDPTGPGSRAPRTRSVELRLEHWKLRDGKLNIEPLGRLELQIAWMVAAPVRPAGAERAQTEVRTGLLQRDKVSMGDSTWNMSHSLLRYTETCGDPDPSIYLGLLEVDEGFGDSGRRTRAALGAAAVGVGIAFPVAGAVFGGALVLEGLLAKNDDLGQGEFFLEDGDNDLYLSGRGSRSIVRVRKIVHDDC